MNKTLVFSLFVVTLFITSATAKPVPSGLENARSLGLAKDVDGQIVEGYILEIKAQKNPASQNYQKNCYAYPDLKGIYMNIGQEPYIIDTTNEDGLSEQDVINSIQNSMNTWDTAVQDIHPPIFGTLDTTGIVDGDDRTKPDGKNEIMFRDITDLPSSVVAYAVIWFTTCPVERRAIIEYDIVFNEKMEWKILEENVPYKVMDLQSIATHELGHAVGMWDLYDAKCAYQTMFGVAIYGHTEKRTLEIGDKFGVNKLYR